MDGLDNTLDGNLVMDAINLVASLESTFESLTFDLRYFLYFAISI